MRTGFRQISALDGKMVCHKSIQASPFLIIIRNDFSKSNIPISLLISCMKLFLTLIFSNEVLVAWQRMAEVPKSCTVIQETGRQSCKLDNKQYRNFQDKELKFFFLVTMVQVSDFYLDHKLQPTFTDNVVFFSVSIERYVSKTSGKWPLPLSVTTYTHFNNQILILHRDTLLLTGSPFLMILYSIYKVH